MWEGVPLPLECTVPSIDLNSVVAKSLCKYLSLIHCSFSPLGGTGGRSGMRGRVKGTEKARDLLGRFRLRLLALLDVFFQLRVGFLVANLHEHLEKKGASGSHTSPGVVCHALPPVPRW